jgi:hypothetical protein
MLGNYGRQRKQKDALSRQKTLLWRVRVSQVRQEMEKRKQQSQRAADVQHLSTASLSI